MSPRVQRLAMRLLRYQFQLTYVPGKHLKIPDTLRRNPQNDTINTDYLENNLRVYSVISTTKENEERLKKAINEDPALQQVKFYIINGWPQHKKKAQPEVRKYWSDRDDIYLHKDILFYHKRLSIPETLKG